MRDRLPIFENQMAGRLEMTSQALNPEKRG
jgi:hypothetical protein